MIVENLKKLELNNNEAQVYLAALELGGTSVQNIAKKSGVHRATTYVALQKLEELGLIITEKKGKKTIYAGQYPHKLLTNILDRQNELKKREAEIIDMLPELNAIFNFSLDKPRIKFFEGKDGVKQIYKDTLSSQENILAFLSIKKFDPTLLKELYQEYVPERIRKGIKALVIAPGEKESQDYQERDQKELRETRLVDPNKYPFSIEIDIYGGNKVAFMSYSSKEMFGVILESVEIHKTMKLIFELVWANIK
ncbi:MAG TPA: helix-turn-helix domain-containing protein [bacterium]|nr:helix-turn-helix domain-containing protein [bacterium]HPL95871.1 helix-turn-helix domain-containing protein [bacterium]